MGTTILTTYNAANQQQEQVTISSLLGISAIAGGGSQVSMILKKPCTQIKIQFAGVNLNVLSATTINYAYVRNQVLVDASAYFSLGNATVTGNFYQLKTPVTGSVSYAITESPTGSSPVISNNKITGMTVNGTYKVMGTYVGTDGKVYTQTAVITRNASSISETDACNTMITNAGNGAAVYAPLGGGCLLCVGEGTNFTGKNNLIDSNPTILSLTIIWPSIAANHLYRRNQDSFG